MSNLLVATTLTKDNWDHQGLNWCRVVKSSGYSALILNQGLSESAQQKIKQFNFELMEGDNIFSALANRLDDSQSCILLSLIQFPRPITQNIGIIAKQEKEFSVDNVVMPIRNIHERAKIASILDEKIVKLYGCLLSPDFIFASKYFWVCVAGTRSLLSDLGYCENRPPFDHLFVNLAVAMFKFPVTFLMEENHASSLCENVEQNTPKS